MITLLSNVLKRNRVEVLLAEDDADTLIVKTALRYALARDVEVKTLMLFVSSSLDSPLLENELQLVCINQSWNF